MSLHPRDVLHPGTATRPLPACDHYCGSASLIAKSLALQARLGPVFDVTADCEDGAPVGAEAEHATMVAGLVVFLFWLGRRLSVEGAGNARQAEAAGWKTAG